MPDEEPRYLRRQKPVEIKRRKFSRQAWKTYLRVTVWTAVGLAAAGAAFLCVRFLLTSPEMALLHPDQISLEGNHYVTRESVRKVFVGDRGTSVLRIPLAERRRQLEAISWVERASVRRVLPNRIQVEITERTPIAFLRHGSELSLVDVDGVILERPLEGDFHFPVVAGIDREMPLESRQERMRLLSRFMEEIGSVKANAADQVSEVDLSDAGDVRATLTGLGNQAGPDEQTTVAGPVLVHFGDGDFAGKYQTLIEEFGTWQASAGIIESVDLRFSREAVVNQDTTRSARQAQPAKGR
ncbi:MAG TPA: FtsQ-type POTRA domain-containing protein [Candidatus Acidoferrales bacterium]|nr:FtsQ-type POTRA domain-containing protein [Candidatus Acidoferrales bacterium]